MTTVSTTRGTVRGALRRRVLRGAGFYLLLAFVLVPFMFVFFYMITTSFKSPLDINAPSFQWFFTPTLDNYREVIFGTDFLTFTINSLIIAAGSTLVSLLIGLPAAFAIARYKMPRLGVVILSSRVTPGITFLIPWFMIFSQLGWIDTFQALILSHLLVNLPLITWLMISFFEDMSGELLDAAAVDGASMLRTFIGVVLPVTKGGIASAAILGFIFSWNNFMFSVVLAGRDTRTLPVAVFEFMSYGSINWGAISAAATVMTLPVVVLALLVQRHIVEGLAGGSIKG